MCLKGMEGIGERIDVLVVGGGVAGIAAARAASLEGARVVLLDASDTRGGKATAAMVGTLCGIWYRHADPRPRPAMAGFPLDFAERLARASGTTPIAGVHGLKFLPYAVDAFATLGGQVLSEAGVEVRSRASLTNCAWQDDAAEVRWTEADAVHGARAGAVVDCTGRAVVSMLCGDRVIEAEAYQAPAQVLMVQGVKCDDAARLDLVMRRALLRADAQAHGIGPVSVVPGSCRDGTVLLKVGLPYRVQGDGDREAIHVDGRASSLKVFELLRHHTEAFAAATVERMAPETGIRTERRGYGRCMLEEADVLTCRKRPDAIANGAWPIEEWGAGADAAMTWFAEGDHYHIPADALRSARHPALFFAGRGLSATERAIASARVMGTCLATGHAAGILAVHQVGGHPASAALAAIQREQVYI